MTYRNAPSGCGTSAWPSTRIVLVRVSGISGNRLRCASGVQGIVAGGKSPRALSTLVRASMNPVVSSASYAARPAARLVRSSAIAPASYSTAMLFGFTSTPPTVARSTSTGLFAETLTYTTLPGLASEVTTPSSRSAQCVTSVVSATAGGSKHPPLGCVAPSIGVPGSQHSPASAQHSPAPPLVRQLGSHEHPELAAPPHFPAHELEASEMDATAAE